MSAVQTFDFNAAEKVGAFYGGASVEGASASFIVKLKDANYVALSFPRQGNPAVARFTVTGDDDDGDAPAGYRVKLYDFGITMPSQIRRNATLKIHSDGPSVHEMDIYKLTPGKTADDFKMCTMDPNCTDIPATQAGGLTIVSPGVTVWLNVRLEPGDYFATCFLPDSNGMPHIMDGMFTTFKVVR